MWLSLSNLLRAVVCCYKILPRTGMFANIGPPNNPALESSQLWGGVWTVDHWKWAGSKIPQFLASVLTISLCFAGPVSAQHIDHDMVRFDTILHEPVQAGKEPFFVGAVIPSGVDPLIPHLVVPIVYGRDSFGGLVCDTAGVNTLVEADFKFSLSNLCYAITPLWLAKKVIIKQEQFSWPRIATPYFSNRLFRFDLPFFLRNYAKRAVQTAASLSESNGLLKCGIDRVVEILWDIPIFQAANFQWRNINARTSDDGIRPARLESIDNGLRTRKNSTGKYGITVVEFVWGYRIQRVGVVKYDFTSTALKKGVETYKCKIRNLAIYLEQSNYSSHTKIQTYIAAVVNSTFRSRSFS
jgi:hypothetical protein